MTIILYLYNEINKSYKKKQKNCTFNVIQKIHEITISIIFSKISLDFLIFFLIFLLFLFFTFSELFWRFKSVRIIWGVIFKTLFTRRQQKKNVLILHDFDHHNLMMNRAKYFNSWWCNCSKVVRGVFSNAENGEISMIYNRIIKSKPILMFLHHLLRVKKKMVR